jgi:hypothetical protein
VLPSFLDEVTLRGLSLGEGRADVVLQRTGNTVALSVLSRSGNLRVVHTA